MIPGGNQAEDDNLLICTTYSGQEFDGPHPWGFACGAAESMAKQVENALEKGDNYPLEIGELMKTQMGWNKGFSKLKSPFPSMMKFTMSYDTCVLLPELTPYNTGSSVTWLDTVAPICRILDHVEQPEVLRCAKNSLAIIYQDDEPHFAKMGEDLSKTLNNDRLIVDLFAGSEFVTDDAARVELLSQVFHRHRAVLFLGHLRQASGEMKGGWHLTRDYVLTMSRLNSFLGGGGHWHSSHKQKMGISSPVPEVVFANCCFSAGSDEKTRGQETLSYPKLFLDAGVRFFIGTSMDVVLSRDNEERDRNILLEMMREFFQAWADDHDNAIGHLYQAKKKCGFHLLTSLYQIYAVGSEQGISRGRQEMEGALVSGISPQDQLGDYVLESEIWSDRYAKTFWATNKNTGSSNLVQVFVDQLQGNSQLSEEMEMVIKKFRAAGLSPGHLIPTRIEAAMLIRQGKKLQRFHIAVYHRPAHEKIDDWFTLESAEFAPQSPVHSQVVLQIGTQVSQLLAELHEKEILHGNLSRSSIVFQNIHGIKQVIIKDSWVHHIRQLRRYTGRHHAIPDEKEADKFKYDCWSLGALLFELASGQPLFGESESPGQGLKCSLKDTMTGPVPEALDRIVRECLLPAASLRPDARSIANRLALAALAGGTYVSDFGVELDIHIQAGHRLFSILIDDIDELKIVLENLVRRPGGTINYRLYSIEEEKGIVDGHSGNVIFPWANAHAINQQQVVFSRQHHLPLPPFPNPGLVASINSRIIFSQIPSLSETPQGIQDKSISIILVCGSSWWSDAVLASRVFKICQAEADTAPVIIIAENFPIQLAPDLHRLFVYLNFPVPSRAALFEQISNFKAKEKLSIPEISEDMAFRLADRFYPCPKREVQFALRMCALRNNVIDERAVYQWEESREERFRSLGTAVYWPVAKLPDPMFMGLSPIMQDKIEDWMDRIPIATRVLISGPGGCGKTSLAYSLASRIHTPLVQVNANQCLRSLQGESEEALRITLAAAAHLRDCVVLLDDVDQFFGGMDNASSLQETMARMSGIILNWLDGMPMGVIAIITAAQTHVLPAQWRRRMELHLELETADDMSYRTPVFAAVFRKFALHDLANNNSLMQELARQTHPRNGIPGLRSPVARRSAATSLAHLKANLTTPADIEYWVRETIRLHYQAGDPWDPGFWYDALAQFKITGDTLDKLKKENITADILDKLEGIKGLRFNIEGEFAAKLQYQGIPDSFHSMIFKYAKEF
jgi:hypothetical protein